MRERSLTLKRDRRSPDLPELVFPSLKNSPKTAE